jgi:hypothetical protein
VGLLQYIILDRCLSGFVAVSLFFLIAVLELPIYKFTDRRTIVDDRKNQIINSIIRFP